ncbi:MAG: gamma-glutamyltransferase, partial [Coleofasciculus sp. B1-GNL1-01]|uniref:gamma-glutamyltransferase family protein n=1 Tax=Coleofasciculus sp. B1-GNL1-01 TaxID=3068484 RepID=UPI0032F98CDE
MQIKLTRQKKILLLIIASMFVNFRETAPLAASADMYLDDSGEVIPKLSTQGYLAVGVPGTVAGLDRALSEYGTMNRQQETVAAIFLDGGEAFQVGERLVQEELAETLSAIARSGASVFYQGRIAQAIVQASQENGGILTLEDFTRYRVRQDTPLRCFYRGYEVVTAPPPGGGVTVCQMLNVLAGYPLREWGWGSVESLHSFLSAALFAYRDRNQVLGDPDFVEIPVKRLLSQEYAAQIREQIGERALNPQALQMQDMPQGTHTTHYSIVDQFGNAVAVTYTINSLFGAKVMAKDTGFFLNNQMNDFTVKLG